ncbi:hypothetical protein EMIT0P44_180110 [Pseudomonas sp. IT-P44]
MPTAQNLHSASPWGKQIKIKSQINTARGGLKVDLALWWSALSFFVSYTHSGLVHQSPVGAGLLAMDVNDDAGCLNVRGGWAFFASRLAPTWDRRQHGQTSAARPLDAPVGPKAASFLILIAGAPLTTLAERRHCAAGKPARMPV